MTDYYFFLHFPNQQKAPNDKFNELKRKTICTHKNTACTQAKLQLNLNTLTSLVKKRFLSVII